MSGLDLEAHMEAMAIAAANKKELIAWLA